MNDVYGKGRRGIILQQAPVRQVGGCRELDSHDLPRSKYLPNPVIYTCEMAGSRQTGDIVVEVVGGRKEASKVGWVGGKVTVQPHLLAQGFSFYSVIHSFLLLLDEIQVLQWSFSVIVSAINLAPLKQVD